MPFAILPGNNLYNSLLFHCKYLFEFAMEFVISHKTKVAQMSPDMKITQVKSNGKSLKNIELPDVMTAIRSGEQAIGTFMRRIFLFCFLPPGSGRKKAG